MLPLFALLLFALLGLGALVVDGGLAFSEQARLDAAAESVALEWSHARALPASTQPTPCLDHAPGTRGNDDCLRAELLAPLLEPLGLAGASDANPLADSPRSLDGTPLAPRGAQLGALTTAGVLEPASDDVVRLTRSTPMLLGWAALPAYAADDEPLDFAAVQALRAQDGISPRFEGTDLRTRGFQVEGQARLAAIGAPAMRVGAMLPGEPDLAGSVGMAWRLDALESLAGLFDLPASARTVDLAASATSAGDRIQLGTVEVGCSFDLDRTSLHVGARLTPPTVLPLSVPARAALAYLPVVEDCASPILGFVQVAWDPAAPGTATGTTTRIVLRRSDGRSLHRNASSTPASASAASVAAGTLDGAGAAALVRSEAAWAPLLVRLPRLADAS
jgi:hypothetical protein